MTVRGRPEEAERVNFIHLNAANTRHTPVMKKALCPRLYEHICFSEGVSGLTVFT